MEKILFYDTETTGLSYNKHCIHQFAGIVQIDGEVVDSITIDQQPHHKALIDPQALSVSGKTEEDIKLHQSFESGHKQLTEFLGRHVNKFDKSDKMYLAGYNNSRFDDKFLETQFALNNDPYIMTYFWEGSLDVMTLASQMLKPMRPEMKSFKLLRVAETLGIKVEEKDLHNAAYDAELTRQIYNTLNDFYQSMM